MSTTSNTSLTVTGFDLRPFLYPSRFEHQFQKIDELAATLPDRAKLGDKAKVD